MVLFLLHQGLAFQNILPRMKTSSTPVPLTIAKSNEKCPAKNVKMNAAIPMRSVSLGTKMFTSKFAVKKQLSLVTNAWKAAILVFVALVSRFKSKVSRAVSTMEGGWSKRGYNGAFWRTVEVWRFVITFVFQYVSNPFINEGKLLFQKRPQHNNFEFTFMHLPNSLRLRSLRKATPRYTPMPKKS